MKSGMKTSHLVIDATLAEDLKSMAYAQQSTVDRVLHELIRRAASDASWTGTRAQTESLHNRRKGSRSASM